MQSNQYGSPHRGETVPQSYFPNAEGQSALNAPPPSYNPDSPRPPAPGPPQYHQTIPCAPNTQTVPATAPQCTQPIQMNPAPHQIPLSANPMNQYSYAPVAPQSPQPPQQQPVGYVAYPQAPSNPTNPVMVVVHQQPQPVAQPNGPANWKYGLCNCFEDCSACCLGFFCPCIAAGEIWDKAFQKGMGAGVCFWLLMIYVPSIIVYLLSRNWMEFIFLAIFHPIWWSIPLREKRGIQGNYITDCCTIFWCSGCRITQELREARDIATQREVELQTKAATVAHQPAPVVYQTAPVMHQAAPVMHQAAPAMHQAAPMMHQSTPGVHQTAPVVQRAAPVHHVSPEYHAPVMHETPPKGHSSSNSDTSASNSW